MTDQKFNFIDFSKIVAKIAAKEGEQIQKENSADSVYVIEEYDTKEFSPKWKKHSEYNNNMFAAMKQAKELSENNFTSNYRIIQKKNGLDETIWYS